MKAPRHWTLCGEFTGTGEFPAQMASYAENVSSWWRHHDVAGFPSPPPPECTILGIAHRNCHKGLLRVDWALSKAAHTPWWVHIMVIRTPPQYEDRLSQVWDSNVKDKTITVRSGVLGCEENLYFERWNPRTPANLANQVQVSRALDQSHSVQFRGPEREHQNNAQSSWRSSRTNHRLSRQFWED